MVDRFSKHIHLKMDGLEGWCVWCSEEERHRALHHVLRHVGYAKTIEKLDFLANISKRDNPHLHRVAREDLAYLERWHREQEHSKHAEER